jgi:outer membrane protein assembly factor BamB
MRLLGLGNSADISNSTTMSNGVVYVADSGVVALRASDGTFLWWGGDSDRLVFSTPLVVDGVVFSTASCKNGIQSFGYCQDQLVALKTSDGKPFWSKTVTAPGAPVLNQEQHRQAAPAS